MQKPFLSIGFGKGHHQDVTVQESERMVIGGEVVKAVAGGDKLPVILHGRLFSIIEIQLIVQISGKQRRFVCGING